MGVSPPSERKEKKKILPQNKQKSDQTEKLANLVVTKNGEEWFWLEGAGYRIYTGYNTITHETIYFQIILQINDRHLFLINFVLLILIRGVCTLSRLCPSAPRRNVSLTLPLRSCSRLHLLSSFQSQGPTPPNSFSPQKWSCLEIFTDSSVIQKHKILDAYLATVEAGASLFVG